MFSPQSIHVHLDGVYSCCFDFYVYCYYFHFHFHRFCDRCIYCQSPSIVNAPQ
jgi:hypothetical protein